jgi:hypothetical protein
MVLAYAFFAALLRFPLDCFGYSFGGGGASKFAPGFCPVKQRDV